MTLKEHEIKVIAGDIFGDNVEASVLFRNELAGEPCNHYLVYLRFPIIATVTLGNLVDFATKVTGEPLHATIRPMMEDTIIMTIFL